MKERLNELERLYREWGPALLAYLMRRCGAPEAAEDVLQETFVEAARHWNRLSEAASRRAWLYAVARNLAAARRRRWRILAWRELPKDVLARPDASEDPRLADLRAAIRELPKSLREVLELRLAEDLSYEEIAEALDIPIGTVRSRIHAAVERLRSSAFAT